MSYSITPDQEVLKDGEKVGYIQGGICYTDDPPKGRGISSFRAMAGIPDLQFKAIPKDTLAAGESFAVTLDCVPAVAASESTTEKSSAVASSLPEPPRHPHLGDKTPEWQMWYVATYGEEAFKSRWPKRQLPQ